MVYQGPIGFRDLGIHKTVHKFSPQVKSPFRNILHIISVVNVFICLLSAFTNELMPQLAVQVEWLICGVIDIVTVFVQELCWEILSVQI